MSKKGAKGNTRFNAALKADAQRKGELLTQMSKGGQLVPFENRATRRALKKAKK